MRRDIGKEEEESRFLRISGEKRARMWKRARTALYVLIALVVMVFLFGGEFGVAALYRYGRFEKKLDGRIEAEEARRDSLEQVMEKLTNDPSFVERMAREKLRMISEGEEIYRFEEGGTD